MKKFILLLIAVLLLAGCRQQEAEDTAPADFETMTVTKSDLVLEQSYPASIEGRQSVKIIPRVEGYLREVRVKEGQQVRRGQVLFVIDQSAYQAEVKAASANVEVARANLTKEQLNYDGSRGLNAHNVVSDHELRTAASSLAMAKAQLRQSEAQLETAHANLSYTVLRSPSDGVVGSLPFRVGDYVGPSHGSLTTVADSHEMFVYFSLTDRGRVESISGVVESSTGSVSARAVFPNGDGRLLSGSTGRLVVPYEMHQVIVIPQAATYEIQDKKYVYRVVEGKASSTIITVLPMTDGKNYVVANGLEVGDIIVAKGAGYVKEGQEIQTKQ